MNLVVWACSLSLNSLDMECQLVGKICANCRHLACSACNIRIAAKPLSATLESVLLAMH